MSDSHTWNDEDVFSYVPPPKVPRLPVYIDISDSPPVSTARLIPSLSSYNSYRSRSNVSYNPPHDQRTAHANGQELVDYSNRSWEKWNWKDAKTIRQQKQEASIHVPWNENERQDWSWDDPVPKKPPPAVSHTFTNNRSQDHDYEAPMETGHYSDQDEVFGDAVREEVSRDSSRSTSPQPNGKKDDDTVRPLSLAARLRQSSEKQTKLFVLGDTRLHKQSEIITVNPEDVAVPNSQLRQKSTSKSPKGKLKQDSKKSKLSKVTSGKRLGGIKGMREFVKTKRRRRNSRSPTPPPSKIMKSIDSNTVSKNVRRDVPGNNGNRDTNADAVEVSMPSTTPTRKPTTVAAVTPVPQTISVKKNALKGSGLAARFRNIYDNPRSSFIPLGEPKLPNTPENIQSSASVLTESFESSPSTNADIHQGKNKESTERIPSKKQRIRTKTVSISDLVTHPKKNHTNKETKASLEKEPRVKIRFPPLLKINKGNQPKIGVLDIASQPTKNVRNKAKQPVKKAHNIANQPVNKANQPTNDVVSKANQPAKDAVLAASLPKCVVLLEKIIPGIPVTEEPEHNYAKDTDEENISAKHKKRRRERTKVYQPPPLQPNKVIGPRDVVTNLGLGKIKMESDYIPPVAVKDEPNDSNGPGQDGSFPDDLFGGEINVDQVNPDQVNPDQVNTDQVNTEAGNLGEVSMGQINMGELIIVKEEEQLEIPNFQDNNLEEPSLIYRTDTRIEYEEDDVFEIIES